MAWCSSKARDWTQALAVQPNGDVVLTGQTSAGAFFAERLTRAGDPDPRFARDGPFTEQFGSRPSPASAGTDLIITPAIAKHPSVLAGPCWTCRSTQQDAPRGASRFAYTQSPRAAMTRIVTVAARAPPALLETVPLDSR